MPSWISVGISAVSFIGSLFGASEKKKAARKAEALGGLNASFIAQESAEETRRLRESQERTTGTAKLGIAASGFRSGEKSMGASHKAYLANLKQVQQSELDWIGKSSLSRQKIAKMGGQAQASQLRASAIGDYASAASSGFEAYGAWKYG